MLLLRITMASELQGKHITKGHNYYKFLTYRNEHKFFINSADKYMSARKAMISVLINHVDLTPFQPIAFTY